MKYLICLLAVLVVLAGFALAEPEYKDYEVLKAEIRELYKTQEYEKAVGMFEKAYELFPEARDNIVLNTLILQAHLDKAEEGLDLWKRAVDDGVWIYVYHKAPWVPRYAGLDEYKEIFRRNEELKKKADIAASWKYKVALPEGYRPGGEYDLFIALHGGVCSMDRFSPNWVSPGLRKDYVVLFVQTSQHAGMNTYTWDDHKKGEREILAALKEMKIKYAFKTKNIVVGGFSAGATQMLHVMLEDSIEGVRGFVFLAPQIPENFNENTLKAMAKRKIRGSIITGEKDHNFELQEKMHEEFETYGIKHLYTVKKAMPHMYPQDLPQLIDQGLEFILRTK